MNSDFFCDGCDPIESLVPTIPVNVATLLEECPEHLVQLSVALLAEVNIAILRAVVEESVHDARLAVIAHFVGAEGQAPGAGEVQRILVSLLLFHAVPVGDDADAVGIPRQGVGHQRQQCCQHGGCPGAWDGIAKRAATVHRSIFGIVFGASSIIGNCCGPLGEDRQGRGSDAVGSYDGPAVGVLGTQPLEGRLDAGIIASAIRAHATEERAAHLPGGVQDVEDGREALQDGRGGGLAVHHSVDTSFQVLNRQWHRRWGKFILSPRIIRA
mmetsp:Transcript_55029/g.154788  ORF Transcript_55029/g.154788 Transcript_55029/m.154788 type:complete len:270 (+) Transcript_55029:1579-2388(+)